MATDKVAQVSKYPPRNPGPKALALVALDERSVSPSYTRAYPFVMARGQGSEVWDVDGLRYVDFTSGIAVTSTGHCHPDVVKAIQDQAAKFLHMSGTDFYYEVQIRLAEKLNSLMPGPDPKKLFFTNSGAESIEAAFKLARYYSGRQRMLAFIGSFHGRTMGALSLTGSKAIHRAGFAPMVPGVTHVPYGYCYRCPLNLKYSECDIACVAFIEKTLFARVVPPEEVAAIFVEPIQGEGGYVVPPPEFLPRLRELTNKHDILLVDDEIQSGIGRTGKMLAIEHDGVVPDIVTLAKGLASGMPLGAMVARADLMTWDPGAHGSTFCGNPVACAAANETLRLVESSLMQNAQVMGKHIIETLQARRERHPSIGDIRGRGLMVGVELVLDQGTKEPAHDLREDVVQKCFERGLLILGCGPNTVRFATALSITPDIADEGLEIFDEALTVAERAAGLSV